MSDTNLIILKKKQNQNFTSLTLQEQTTDQNPAGPAVPGEVGGVKLQTPHLTVSHTGSRVKKKTGWD